MKRGVYEHEPRQFSEDKLPLPSHFTNRSHSRRSNSESPQQADTQSWNDLQFTIPLNKEIDMILLGTIRIGRNSDSSRR